MSMTELLEQAIAVHGGMQRWTQIRRFTAHISLTSPLLAKKGVSGILGQPGGEFWLEREPHVQRVRISPFEPTGRRAVFTPERTAIETEYGQVIDERLNPRAHFAAYARETPWDDLDLMYLRRLDYAIEILGSVPSAHYAYEHREFDGIIIPTRRRVYARLPDGQADRDRMALTLDVMTFAAS